MKKIVAVVVAALVIVAAAVAPSFAKETKDASNTVGAKMPKIVRFTGDLPDERGNFADKIAYAEKAALRQAEAWIAQNYKRVRIISHSLTGNYLGHHSVDGFSTVTILYEER